MKLLSQILIISFLLTGAMAYAEDYAVVVHPSNDYSGNVKNYFLLKQGHEKWPNGKDVKPFDLKSEEDLKLAVARSSFIKKILGMSSPEDLKQHWIREKSKGRTNKAQVLNDIDSMIRNVKREPGAIGFAPKSTAESEGLKVIKSF